MIKHLFSRKQQSDGLRDALAESCAVFAVVDAGMVAGEGRDRLTQFCLSHKLQPTADIERFVASLQFTRDEKQSFTQAVKNRKAYSAVFTQPVAGDDSRRYLFVITPVSEGGWVLQIQDFERIAPAVAPLLKTSAPKEHKATATDAAVEDAGWERYLEQAPIPTAILTATGVVRRQNAALGDLVGGMFRAKSGWRFLDCLAEGSREEVAARFAEVIADTPGAKRSLEVRLAGDGDATVSLYVSRIEEEGGAMPSFLLHMIDLTEQKNLEMRFVHSQKMQAVGQLAGGIAHDFNNLLTAMIGFCDLLLIRHPAGDQSFADIMQIKQNANRAANLVRQLLAFSRKQTLRPEVVSITDTLADLANLIRRLIGENIEFKLTHGRDIWPVKVDQGQLEQVIINLAVNGRDAMHKGGILRISTETVSISSANPLPESYISPAEDDVIVDGEYVKIEVVDTGHGIPPEIIRKIFEPFFSTKEVGAGTGLGLSTVYGIVKQTGGYIYVQSRSNEGTNFAIFLKRFQPSEAEPDVGQATGIESDSPVAADLTGTGRILLVEDEAPVRIFSARALRNKGYTVLEADCAEAGLKLVEENKGALDLIVTDVVMPGMTGPNMVEEVHKRYPDVKVVFMSGYAEDAFIKTYGSERSFHFLPKPFSLKQLASKVKEVIEAK